MPTRERFRPGASRLALFCLAAGVAFAAAASADDGETVGSVGGTEIGREELMNEASDALEEVDLTRLQCELEADRNGHAALEQALDRIVRRRLLELEAADRGIEPAALEQEIRAAAAPVADEDVDRFYEQNKARIRGSKEEVADQIRDFLLMQNADQAESLVLARLEAKHAVDRLLDPLRSEVAADGHPARGDSSAPVTIVEFSDFECPYCRRVLPTLDQVEERYGDQVRLVFRQFPLSIHANAQKAAEASLCASEQDRFWEMHDLMFDEQQTLTVADLKDKAGRIGLDTEAFAACLDSDRHAERVRDDLKAGVEAGVSGTPAMFVNGRFVSGAVPFETLAELIDDELRRNQG
jgi:protein-disulfide isomerase